MLRRGLTRAGEWLPALAALAAALALAVPSKALAERSDLVLAALVLFTALGIAPAQLASLADRKAALGLLVVAPFVALAPLAWLISRLFSGSVRDGVLALGVSSTEVAAVGLVALAGGSAVLALGALTGSLVVSALAGPLVLGALSGGSSDVAVGPLVGRFALVVVVPLAVGLLVRWRVTRLDHAEGELGGLGTIAVVVLVYAAMSGARQGGDPLPALAAGALFLVASAAPAAAWTALAPAELRSTGALVVELRDFAVAAALAAQAFGPAAATVSGVYGVLMLLLGSAAAHLLARSGVPDARTTGATRSAPGASIDGG
jgi:BASS family bile acid:Na+ symporter